MHFLKVKSSFKSSSEATQKCSDSEEESTTDACGCLLFSCSKEGCVKTYQRFSALQHHLDCGRHECALEHDTLLDNRLQQRSGGVPLMQEVAEGENTEIQKEYLSRETTGHKLDAASVAKSMMTARDSNGNRLFTSSEFLTSQQVSSFFLRLSSLCELTEKSKLNKFLIQML